MAKRKLPTIVFICGLIGSGKTTYARSNYKTVTDLDDMVDGSTKKDQIKLSKYYGNTNKEIAHITCYPTPDELHAFDKYTKRFLWIDTSERQCTTNVLIRNRDRDMKNLASVFSANKNYTQLVKDSDLAFEKIQVF